MTVLIKMQKTLVIFSLILMLKVRVLFIFLRRWIWINLPRQEHEKKRKIQRVDFWKLSSVYTEEYCYYNMSVLKIVLIFINILLRKPFLNPFFLIAWLWSSCCYPFFKNHFFSPLFVCVADIVRAQNCFFFFIFTNLI